MRWQVSQRSQGLSWRKRLCLNCFKDPLHRWINIYLGYCSRLEIFVFNVRLDFLNNGVRNIILNVIQDLKKLLHHLFCKEFLKGMVGRKSMTLHLVILEEAFKELARIL